MASNDLYRAGRYGYGTHQVAMPPFLRPDEVREDFLYGDVPGVHRRPGEHTSAFIHKAYLEDYYHSKELPEYMIEYKMNELGLVFKGKQQTKVAV